MTPKKTHGLGLIDERESNTGMKKYLLAIVVVMLSLSGCSVNPLSDESMERKLEKSYSAEIDALFEQARWGDGQAYLQLANSYRDGKGVKKDFVGMLTMASQAEKFGSISKLEDYLKTLPEGSEFKLIYDAVERLSHRKMDEATTILEQLNAICSVESYVIQGMMDIEDGEIPKGICLMEYAAEAGSSFAELMLFITYWQGFSHPDVEKMATLSDKIPFVNNILAKIYMGFENEDMIDDKLAAHYYLKADEKACLSKEGARWLLYYHRNSEKLQLPEREIQRLQFLAGETSISNQDPTGN